MESKKFSIWYESLKILRNKSIVLNRLKIKKQKQKTKQKNLGTMHLLFGLIPK